MSNYWRWVRVIAPLAILLSLAVACPTRPIETPIPSPQKEMTRYFPQSLEREIDILFMIDNSSSMEPIQANLKKNFPALIDALRTPKLGGGPGCSSGNTKQCVIPNVRIGVISSDLGAGSYPNVPECSSTGGDRGKLINTPRTTSGCAAPKDPWISFTQDPLTKVVTNNIDANVTDPLKQVDLVRDAFQCIALVGASGCGYEQPLEAAWKALDPKQGINKGFLRDSAFLAIVWITNEDDCSAQKLNLFDPSQQGINDPLGPLQSFRCTEFGIQCDGKDMPRTPGVRNNCTPGPHGATKENWLIASNEAQDAKDNYVKRFASLKPPGRAILFAISAPEKPVEVEMGPNGPALKPSCQGMIESSLVKGDPAIRMKAVVHDKTFGDNGLFNGLTKKEEVECAKPQPNQCNGKASTTICSGDYSPALKRLGEVIVATLGAQCLSSPPLNKKNGLVCQAGVDLGNGVTCATSCLEQADCEVTEFTYKGTAAENEKTVPKCPSDVYNNAGLKNCAPGDNCPCWRIIHKPTDCKPSENGSPYGLEILRQGDAPKGTTAKAACNASPLQWGSKEYSSMPQCNAL